MQWRQIRYALEVAKNGSFTRAAERLHVSQPALSEQVKLLEERLGFTLFVRTGRGAEVTEKGRTFLHEAGRIANDMIHLQDVARHLRADSRETVKIGMISGLAPVLLQRLFPTASALGSAQIEIRTAPTRVILEELFGGRLDLGFAISADPEFIPIGLTVDPLFDVELVLIAPPAHPIAKAGSACTVRQLAGEPIIMSELSVGYGLSVMNMFGRLGMHPRIRAVVDNVETMVALVKAGLGLAIVPSVAASYESQLGEVSVVTIEPAQRVTVELYRPRGGGERFKEDLFRQIIGNRVAMKS